MSDKTDRQCACTPEARITPARWHLATPSDTQPSPKPADNFARLAGPIKIGMDVNMRWTPPDAGFGSLDSQQPWAVSSQLGAQQLTATIQSTPTARAQLRPVFLTSPLRRRPHPTTCSASPVASTRVVVSTRLRIF